MVDEVERQAWIALVSTPGIGEESTAALLTRFGGPRAVLAAALDGKLAAWIGECRSRDGRPPINAKPFAELMATATDPGARLSDIDALGLTTLTSLDAGFPLGLRDLDPPPAVMHVLGDADQLSAPRLVAVVGTRRPTAVGRLLATRVVRRLVECGVTVVSGLAVGIDGAAHAATLEAGGQTVAVIGGGHCHPGVRAHAALRAAIVEHGGAIVSEHHPAMPPAKGTFPRRNRIIAALGSATIVIEAPRRSGALITARLALELGRPVFVAPGRVGDWATAGSLALLRETPAQPLVGLDELIEDLGYLSAVADAPTADAPAAGAQTGGAEPALAMLGSSERAVAARLVSGPASLDVLVQDTGLSPTVVSSVVTLLLMRGWVQSAGPAFVVSGPLAR